MAAGAHARPDRPTADAAPAVFTTTAPDLHVGRGAALTVGRVLARRGVRRALVVTDPGVEETGHPARVAAAMAAWEITATIAPVARVAPTAATLSAAGQVARGSGPWDAVVAVGGGSTIDTAKAVALALADPGELLDHLAPPVGDGRVPSGPLPPLVAIPTTAGAGAEASPVCVVHGVGSHVEAVLDHPSLRPTLVVVDADLTATGPPAIVASTGFDAVCHALEAWTARPFDALPHDGTDGDGNGTDGHGAGRGADPVTDLWATRALVLLGRGLRAAVADGDDRDAHDQVALGATFAALAAGGAGLHLPHAVAHVVTERHRVPEAPPGIPHAAAVAVVAPEALRSTFTAAPDRHLAAAALLDPEGDALAAASGAADEPEEVAAARLPETLARLARDLGLPRGLAQLGFDEDDLGELAVGTLRQERRLAVCPTTVGPETVAAILTRALRSR